MPVSLFYSYAHKDEELKEELWTHLAPLRMAGLISEWHDRDITAGTEWERDIDKNMMSADIILLLISADFFASKYCWSVEMRKALERHGRHEARAIPVILRPCLWENTPIAKLQALPTDGKPVICPSWDRDEAFTEVVRNIRRIVSEISEPVSPPPAAYLENFAVFRHIEAPWCPELVVLPAQVFLMGSRETEEGRADAEGPQHEVKIASRFAIGLYPVTVDEYRRFVEAWGRSHKGGIYTLRGEQDPSKTWENPGFDQTDRHPTVGVSWEDAKEYVSWLARQTLRPYRLLSEAEWEYACRAGTMTRYAFGDRISSRQANYGAEKRKTTEVGSYPRNNWGLYDMHGNVWEWVEDVWHPGYRAAPDDGKAWTHGGESELRVVRGGSFCSVARSLRSASRQSLPCAKRMAHTGLRIACDL